MEKLSDSKLFKLVSELNRSNIFSVVYLPAVVEYYLTSSLVSETLHAQPDLRRPMHSFIRTFGIRTY